MKYYQLIVRTTKEIKDFVSISKINVSQLVRQKMVDLYCGKFDFTYDLDVEMYLRKNERSERISIRIKEDFYKKFQAEYDFLNMSNFVNSQLYYYAKQYYKQLRIRDITLSDAIKRRYAEILEDAEKIGVLRELYDADFYREEEISHINKKVANRKCEKIIDNQVTNKIKDTIYDDQIEMIRKSCKEKGIDQTTADRLVTKYSKNNIS